MLSMLPEIQRREVQKAALIKIICFFVWNNQEKLLEAIGFSESLFNNGADCVQSAYAGIRFVNNKRTVGK